MDTVTHGFHYLLTALVNHLGRPCLVEFDYHDRLGWHHGCCYIPLFFSSDSIAEKQLRRYGYRNIELIRR